jgi:L-asparagine transporter-like permease
MIDLLFTVIVFCIVGGLLWWLVSMLPLPEPFPTFIKVCVVLILILVLLGVMFGGVSLPVVNFRR